MAVVLAKAVIGNKPLNGSGIRVFLTRGYSVSEATRDSVSSLQRPWPTNSTVLAAFLIVRLTYSTCRFSLPLWERSREWIAAVISVSLTPWEKA